MKFNRCLSRFSLFGVLPVAAAAHFNVTVTDLGPGGACATTGNQQVGVAGNHAAVWSGSSESLVGLAPAGAEWSRAIATGGRQRAHLRVVGGMRGIWV